MDFKSHSQYGVSSRLHELFAIEHDDALFKQYCISRRRASALFPTDAARGKEYIEEKIKPTGATG